MPCNMSVKVVVGLLTSSITLRFVLLPPYLAGLKVVSAEISVVARREADASVPWGALGGPILRATASWRVLCVAIPRTGVMVVW